MLPHTGMLLVQIQDPGGIAAAGTEAASVKEVMTFAVKQESSASLKQLSSLTCTEEGTTRKVNYN